MRFLAILAGILMTAFAAQAQEKDIPLSEVPEAVMDAANDAAEGITFDSVAVEDMGGETKYGFTGKRADGVEFDVDVAEDGEVLEVEEHITADAAPAAVKALLDRYVPGMKVTEAERLVNDERAVIYEFEGTDADGNEVDVDIPWNASEITIESGN